MMIPPPNAGAKAPEDESAIRAEAKEIVSRAKRDLELKTCDDPPKPPGAPAVTRDRPVGKGGRR